MYFYFRHVLQREMATGSGKLSNIKRDVSIHEDLDEMKLLVDS